MQITKITDITGITRRLKGGGGVPFKSDLNFDFFARDVGSLTLQDKVAGNDAEVVGGVYAVIATTATLSFADLSGVTIVDSEGTSTPSISGNDINFTAGYISYLELSDGTKLYFNGNLYDSNSGIEIVGSGFDFQYTTAVDPQSTQDALDLGYYQNDTTGEQLINKALNTTGLADTTGWTEHEGGKMHNFIDSYVDLQPSDAAMALETELVVNGDFATGDTTGWSFIDCIGSVGTHYGFDNVCEVEVVNPSTIYPYQTLFEINKTYKVITSVYIPSVNGVSEVSIQTDTAGQRIKEILKQDSWVDVSELAYTTNIGAAGRLVFYVGSATIGNKFYIKTTTVKTTPTKYEQLNRANTTIYDQAVRDSEYYDSSNPYLWHISELNYDTWNAYLNPAYQGRNFEKIETNYGTKLFTDRIFSYATQKTGQGLIDVLNYINYNYLADGYEYLLDSEGNKVYDSEGKVITTPIS